MYHLARCEPLEAPQNGVVRCTGHLQDDECYITCDLGYNLEGSPSYKVCQKNATWSGGDALCTKGKGFYYSICDHSFIHTRGVMTNSECYQNKYNFYKYINTVVIQYY